MNLMHEFTVESRAPLGIDGFYVGSYHDLGGSPTSVRRFGGLFASTHASATDGAKVQASPDGVDWFDVAVATLSPNVPVYLEAPVVGKFMRLTLTNGGVAATGTTVISTRERS